MAQEKMNVVVTSSWTAAYAQMAGIHDFDILAPSNMQHPSEYELQIEDIMKLKNADLIICGGYEIMMEKIRKGLKIESEKILQVKTDYNADHIKQSIQAIANKAGSIDEAEKNLDRIQNIFEISRAKLKEAGIIEVPVISQYFLRTFSEELGLMITGTYGPRQLEAFDIQELMNLDFELILDNAHNPSAQPLVESKKGVQIAYLINFPGIGNTVTIEDVVRYNVEMIIEAYSGK
jgi:hypothetical protein